ncbi:hypothetical protein ACIPRI_24000 [Variovorax sp. LARHSF232]
MSHDNIELMVDEPIPGHYYWMLLKEESPDQYPRAIAYAEGPLPSYSAAMMAGIAALQRRADERSDGNGVPVVTSFVDRRADFGHSHPGGLHRHH